MENSEKTPNWIPTSFTTASVTGEGDSASSFQSITTPGSTAVDLQSIDQSFDISRQKSSISNEEKTGSESTSAINIFEEDARSSWSEEPKQTEFKETVIDDSSLPIDDSSRPLDESSRPVDESSRPIDESCHPVDESSPIDESSPPIDESSPPIDESSPPIDESSPPIDESSPPIDESSRLIDESSRPIDESSRPMDVDESSRPMDVDESSPPIDNSSRVIDESSQPIDDSSRVIDDGSHPIDGSSRPIDDSSRVIDDSSRVIDDSSRIIDDNSRVIDESSRTSISSHKSTSKKACTDGEENKREFPPENLCEYMWPQENGEFYILQEQICDYLNVKSFKRKYPDLVRRPVEVGEKEFLKEKGVVTEMQCDLGLTALRSEEVLELLSKDYPDHYKEYIKVLREKEHQSITEKHKEFAATNSDKSKMIDLVKKAVQSAAEYNAHLNQERREERRSCMDLQTFTIHYPVKGSKIKKNTKPGKYPVALLPGQFQDYYKEYTPNELRYLPVNTVLYGPLKELNSIKALSDGSQSDSDDSTASDGSCCSSSQGTHDDSSSGSEKPDANKKPASDTNNANKVPGSSYQPKVKPNALCKVCKGGAASKLKDGKPEELVHCSDCENSAHPTCIGLMTEVVTVVKTYPWQCMDCKMCSHCKNPNEEDKMLFCDVCDRGYHTFCVGLKSLPQGKWICRQCGTCSVCGANRPGPESTKAQWQYDITIKIENEPKSARQPKLLCLSCFKKKR